MGETMRGIESWIVVTMPSVYSIDMHCTAKACLNWIFDLFVELYIVFDPLYTSARVGKSMATKTSDTRITSHSTHMPRPSEVGS